MKILVMGAGAIGAYFGARLQQAGEQVIFCARGENLRALKAQGVEFKSYQGDFSIAVTATGDPGDFAPYDLILFCVKSYDTATAAVTLEGCLNLGGAILTLQNGVESAEQLKKGSLIEGVAFEDALPVLHAMTENVLLEIQKTFDFFKATAASDRIDRVLLSGGASRVTVDVAPGFSP